MRKLILLFLITSFIFLISGCTQPQQPPPPTPSGLGTLTGVVKGTLNNTVLYKAEVLAEGGGKVYKTSTDKEGKYTLHLPAGTYTVTASMETFNSASLSVSISENQTKTQDFTLTTGTGQGTPPEYTIQGWIVAGVTLPTSLDTKSINVKVLKEKKLEKIIDVKKSVNKIPKDVNKVVVGKDYASYIAALPNSPQGPIPWGVKGVRFYISESINGPFTLLGLGSVEDGVQVYSLNPDTTYYCRLSIYGTWGEVEFTTDPLQVQTPKALTLLSPENNAEVSLPIDFQWNSLGDTFWYHGMILDTNLGEVGSFDTDQLSYEYSDLTYGDYYWFVAGMKGEEGETLLKAQISISYFRAFSLPSPAGPNLVQNGNFSTYELSPWQPWHITGISDSWDVNASNGYLYWFRGWGLWDGGLVGAIQNLGNYDTSGATKVYLSFDIRIDNQSLSSDGWSGGEYPAAVQVVFVDGSGNEYVYKKCFILEGSPINYPENNVTEIPINTWYHFEVDLMQDQNVASQIATHPYIKEIRVYGNGWDFEGGADNIYLGVQ